MAKKVFCIVEHELDAEGIVNDLRLSGIAADDISLLDATAGATANELDGVAFKGGTYIAVYCESEDSAARVKQIFKDAGGMQIDVWDESAQKYQVEKEQMEYRQALRDGEEGYSNEGVFQPEPVDIYMPRTDLQP